MRKQLKVSTGGGRKSLILANIVVIVLNYILSKLVVFKKQGK